jgi:SEC-C motif domain protein
MTKKSLAGMGLATACPCRAGDDSYPAPLSYAECCEPWHVGFDHGKHAPTPEQLMRSRYSAYALAQPGYQRGPDLLRYLQNTWHSSTVPIDLELSPSHWLRLQVMDAQTAGNAGVVEFVAIYKVNGKAHRLHETSRFVRSNDGARWVYIDGEGA